ASPMGRQIWKRYYETPPVERQREDVSMLAVPLVQRIAEGQIELTAATVVASYECATAERDDRTQMTLNTPTCWQWEISSSKAVAVDPAEPEREPPPAAAPARSRAPRSGARALVVAT